MKFLADENIHWETVSFLRRLGCDVADIKERKLFGLEDAEVLTLAHREGRFLFTIGRED